MLDAKIQYSNDNFKNKSANTLLIDHIKKLFNIRDSNKYHNNDLTKFYHRLLSLAKQFDLGKNITIEKVYEEFTPEYIFTIQVPRSLSKEMENEIFFKINTHMTHFCKMNNMPDFLKDAYIIFEWIGGDYY